MWDNVVILITLPNATLVAIFVIFEHSEIELYWLQAIINDSEFFFVWFREINVLSIFYMYCRYGS